MGGPRGSTLRQVAQGSRCYACNKWLGAAVGRERACEACQPRHHRVLLNFMPARGHSATFLAEDAQTSVGRRLYLASDAELEALVARGGGDVEGLQNAIRQWGQGSVWLSLTDEQYARLIGKKVPKRAEDA